MPHVKPRTYTVRPDHFDRLRENTHILYRCFNRKNVLLYVGITNNPENRFKQHKANKPWWSHVDHIEMQVFQTRLELAEAESNVIQLEQPMFNAVVSSGVRPQAARRRGNLWPEASAFGTVVPDHGFLIEQTLEQQLYPCVECHARAIHCEGDTVACGLCTAEWTYEQWFDMTFNAKPGVPHQMRLL